MGLFSIFRRTAPPARAPAATESGDAVLQARTRARRRLIGAAVLLAIGVIGFPLVFESRPRPIPIDIPIEIPKKDGAPALVMPPARSSAGSLPAAARGSPPSGDEVITESSADAGREISVAAAASHAASARSVSSPAAERPKVPAEAPKALVKATPAKAVAAPAAAASARPAVAANASAPASASASAADGVRFVVQVGAFAEADSAREARAKVEKLGLKTYTQVAQTPSGSRIRVRVGPFASRAEADAALARARGAGLAAVVLAL